LHAPIRPFTIGERHTPKAKEIEQGRACSMGFVSLFEMMVRYDGQ